MGRRRRARHSQAPRHWTDRIVGLPWVTLVLLAGLLVGGAEVLRQDEFAATATLSAPTWVDADRASVVLSGPRLAAAVTEEVELEPGFRGDLRLEVADNDERLEVVVRAVSTDPRLAALAADTALALVLRDHPDVDYAVLATAAIPTEPVRPASTWWVWVVLVALAGALWVEGAHRVRRRDRRGALVGEVAR